ncbi:uncharacterized protein STEHIDRAFT_118131 [Stereum hirsutum FP-91666 SS1]|uniref:uncharacterized protein n=1 Tax=Stereum hirsutum (strain FP-91666) TaxID=721885 RepID=UPI000440E292|nr:uncharacterized protein STEHIDRAFT_118131 [Stereum hirsutum FP-91666 SS1]EIM90919.1 hypothetical protein STEHIDRAFT_118131 [Stereum hirsutum FP-91666 SS1]
MKSFTAIAALVAVVPALVSADLLVNTPTSVVQCEPAQFTWQDGTPPYFLTLIPAGQPSASPLKDFGTQTGTSYTWKADLAANTNFDIALKDSTGATVYSSQVTIQTSSDSSCVNSTVEETGSSSSSGSSGSSVSTSSSTTSTSASDSTSPTSSTRSSSASSGSSASGSAASASGSASSTASSSASTASSSSAASGGFSIPAFGLAGVMGLVGAALF